MRTLFFIVFGCFLAFSSTAPSFQTFFNPLEAAAKCNTSACLLPDCRCAETGPPANLSVNNTPQFVMLTFDDDVNKLNFNNYYKPAHYGRKNPDGCNISITLFVSHEYTEYDLVHDLYVNGHEIALHSITHSSNSSYWKTLPVADFIQEFGDERTLISHWANIPIEDITGMRLPLLQLSGENSYAALKQINLTYDCSWPTQHYINPGLWPYTLDYASFQDCPIEPCPVESHPGVWVQPMLEWTDNSGIPCNMVDACVNIPTDADGILEYIKRNFHNQYDGDRAPFGFYMHSAWFDANPERFTAYVKFLDYLGTLRDVYLVSVQDVINYAKNPVPLNSTSWPKCRKVENPTTCRPNNCALHNSQGEERYMKICLDDCPDNYPWLNNPLGL